MPSFSNPDLQATQTTAQTAGEVTLVTHSPSHAQSTPSMIMVGAQRIGGGSVSGPIEGLPSSFSANSLGSLTSYSNPSFDLSTSHSAPLIDKDDDSPKSNSSSSSLNSIPSLSEMGEMACAFGEDHGKLVLKAGTFNKIVEWIVFERDCDRDTHIRFLLTYKLHSTPQELFKVVTESFTAKSATTKEALKPKLAAFLREWASRAMATDFRRGLFKHLLNFVIKELPTEANFFKLLLIKDSARLNQKPTVVSPKLDSPVIFDWTTVSPEVMAQQITLYEWEIFQEIQPREFYSNAWQKQNKESLSPNLTQLARFFNTLSFWVATEIIKAWQQSPSRQLRVLKRILLMADKLHELHNFDGLMAVISALSNSSISRLRRMWDSLSDKYHEIHQKLEDVMKPTQNFKVYREIIAAKPKEVPMVPYLAVYLRDITFVGDGNPDRTSDGLINFEKIILLGSRIQEVQASTSTPYVGIAVDPSVRAFIKHLNFWEDDELYNQSLLCEPLKGVTPQGTLSAIPEESEEDLTDGSESQSHSYGSSTQSASFGTESWSIYEVCSWLDTIGKTEYKELFERNAINGSRLMQLDDGALVSLGMTRLGHRKRLLKDIQEVSVQRSQRTPSTPAPSGDAVLRWSQSNIDNWIAAFRDTEIAGSLKNISPADLLALTHDSLIARGLDRLGLRKKVLKAVQSLKEGSNDNIYYKDVSQWTSTDVGAWLDSNELGEYKNLFVVHEVAGDALLCLTNEDFIHMGIGKLGHRKALQKNIQCLKEQNDFRRQQSPSVYGSSPSLRVSSSSSSSSSSLSSSSSSPGPNRQRRRSNPLPLVPSTLTPPPSSNGPRRSSLPNTPQDESPLAKAALGDSSDEGASCGYSDDDTLSTGSAFDLDSPQSGGIKLQCFVGNNSTTSRMLTVRPTISMYQLTKKLQKEFGKRMNIKFIDKDGDLVTISDTDSLSVALLAAQISGGRLVLYLNEKPSRRSRSTTSGATSS